MTEETVTVRVMVLETWDEIPLTLPLTATVAHLKREALAAARAGLPAERCELKFRGALCSDEATLGSLNLVPDANLIVLPRRRIPVR